VTQVGFIEPNIIKMNFYLINK